MKPRNREERIGRLLFSVQRFVLFFALVAFIVSCCMMLFVSSMVNAMNLTLTTEGIQQAAKLTMANGL